MTAWNIHLIRYDHRHIPNWSRISGRPCPPALPSNFRVVSERTTGRSPHRNWRRGKNVLLKRGLLTASNTYAARHHPGTRCSHHRRIDSREPHTGRRDGWCGARRLVGDRCAHQGARSSDRCIKAENWAARFLRLRCDASRCIAACSRACRQAGYSAHSLRSAFVTEAGQRPVPLAETMAMSGHVSVASVVGYSEATGIWR